MNACACVCLCVCLGAKPISVTNQSKMFICILILRGGGGRELFLYEHDVLYLLLETVHNRNVLFHKV